MATELPKLSDEQVKQAKAVLAALQAMVETAETSGEPLPVVATTEIIVKPVEALSQTVAQAVANSQAARKKFHEETEAKRRAALAVSILSEIGKVALPGIGTLLGKVL